MVSNCFLVSSRGCLMVSYWFPYSFLLLSLGFIMFSYGFLLSAIISFGFQWFLVVSYWFATFSMAFYSFILVSLVSLWFHILSYWFRWFPWGFQWFLIDCICFPHGFLWFLLVQYNFLCIVSLVACGSLWFLIHFLWFPYGLSWFPYGLLWFNQLHMPSQGFFSEPTVRSLAQNRNKCSKYHAWTMRESYFEPLPNFPPYA